MEKLRSQKEYSGFSWFNGLLIGASLVNIAHVLVVDSFQEDDKREQIAEVQVRNEQIEAELNKSFDSVDGLILEGDSFTFETEDGQMLEVCTGDFKVTDEVAQITGTLTCERVVSIEENKN